MDNISTPPAVAVVTPDPIADVKNLINASGAILVFIAQEIKKHQSLGLTLEDVAQKLISDTAFLGQIKTAVEGVPSDLAEIKSVNFQQGIELAQLLYSQVLEVVKASKA